MRPSFKAALILAIVVTLISLAITTANGRVSAPTNSTDAAATGDSRHARFTLHGEPALDYLRQHGLFERIRTSVDPSRPEITRKPAPEILLSIGEHRAGSTTRSLLTPSPLFTEARKLTASDGTTNASFGYSVGISGDTVVVGGFDDDTFKGSAYIYARNKGGADSWGEVKKLTIADGEVFDAFGFAVGISGDTVVVGARSAEGSRGAAYVFERNKGGADNWGEVRKLIASDGPVSNLFGTAVAINGKTVVVGAAGNESRKGAAYIFERNNGGADNWGEVRKLAASDGAPSDQFGCSVGVSGDWAVVGSNGDEAFTGSAYIYERNKGGADNWGEARKLIATDAEGASSFGTSVGIDGDKIISGAPVDRGKGSAYVFERNGGGADNWGQVRKLVASDGALDDFFGNSVAISGDTAFAGASFDESNKGAGYIFERNKGGADNWGEVRKLTASDGAAGDLFGGSIGINNGTIIAGTRGDDSSKGSTYVFVSRGDQWIEGRKPTASDGLAGDRFGSFVAVSGDTLVVSAFRDDSRKGSAYIFKRNAGGADSWSEVRKLTASDGASNDQFGISVAISGDTVVIGAVSDPFNRASAYVFERNKGGPDSWGEVKKLTSDGTTINDGFGVAVSIGGDTLVVGAPYNSNGAVYVFGRNKGGADNWGQVRKLAASDGAVNDRFGISVGLERATVVVGADGAGSNRGSAYIFERNQGGVDNWGEVRKLAASDGAASDQFGFFIGISGDKLIIGAPSDDSFKGSAYVFERNKGGADNWGEVKKLTASDGAPSEYFGAVAIAGDTVVVGSFGDDSRKGSVFVFERNKGGADNWGTVRKVTALDGAANDGFGALVAIDLGTMVAAAPGDDASKGSAYIFTAFPEAVSVSAASYQQVALAPEMIVAAFGIDLATGTEPGGTIPLPTNLRGTTVSVRDSAGMERLAQLFFVSPGQVNYYMPAGTSAGPATVKVTSGSGQITYGMVEIAAISPGLFSANSTGEGVAAALALRVRGAQQTYEQLSRYDAPTSAFVPIPVDLGPAGDEIILVMFGTGFRFRSSDSGVTVKVGGRTLQSLYTGVASDYVGLDQMNISALPRDLVGAGVIKIEITIDGKVANTTTVSIK